MTIDELREEVGSRVELHPATDAWMSGDKYGEIIKAGKATVLVHMDVSGRDLQLLPRSIGSIIRPAPEPEDDDQAARLNALRGIN